MGRPRKYTDEQLLELLRAQAKDLGRTPTRREARPNASAYINRFGSWPKSVALAGLPSRKRGENLRRPNLFRASPPPPPNADAITRAKQQFWANGGKEPTTWVHPYRQRRSA